MHSSVVPTRNLRSKNLDAIRQLPLEPEEYCRRWVPLRSGKQPGERGYRTACIRELAKVTGANPSSININWGARFEKRPQYVPRLLRLADIINQFQ